MTSREIVKRCIEFRDPPWIAMHFLHPCCGQVREYMDFFAEAGCDVLQLDQPAQQ